MHAFCENNYTEEERSQAVNILKQAKINVAMGTTPSDLKPIEIALYMCIFGIANDHNSSSFRENMTCNIAGYENLPGKLGYDAKKNNTPVEIKPKNYYDLKPKSKLNGGGNFTDFRWERDKKYSDDNVLMCVSGFCNGILLYIVEFAYDTQFRNKIQSSLERALPNGDVKGKYCRSAAFSYLNWADSNPTVIWCSPNFDNFRNCMSDRFYKFFKSTLLNQEIPLTARQIVKQNEIIEKENKRKRKKELNMKKRTLNKMKLPDLLKEADKCELNLMNIPKTKKGSCKVDCLRRSLKKYYDFQFQNESNEKTT